MRSFFPIFLVLTQCIILSCHSNIQNNAVSGNDTALGQSPPEKVPLYRTEINKEPVAEYQQKIKNDLNVWYFSVKLFETQKTFYYLIKMQYEEVRGEDTLKLPNLGYLPKVAIHAGGDEYSCVLGFIDVQNKFSECKLISIEDGNIKLTTLKHYYGAVYTK